MKHLLLFLAALVAMPPAVAGDYMSLRLMTYNVHNCIGTDRQTDIERIAAIVRRQAPDVVAVQEVDSATQRSGGRYVLGELASLTGMHANFARAIDFQGGAYGIGVLSKRKPLSCTMCPLPGREEERALLVVEFPGFSSPARICRSPRPTVWAPSPQSSVWHPEAASLSSSPATSTQILPMGS